MARERGAWVVFGGIHATMFPDEAREHAPHAVVKGDGDEIGQRSWRIASPGGLRRSTTAGW